MVNICTACCDIKKLCIVTAHCAECYNIILTINTNYLHEEYYLVDVYD